MIAKMILPFLGGSPAVWNMSLFFFQALLLAGYLYAHLGSSWLGTKGHAIVHVAMVVFAVSFLPVFIPHQWFSVSVDQPAKLILSVLLASVGFPFLCFPLARHYCKSGLRAPPIPWHAILTFSMPRVISGAWLVYLRIRPSWNPISASPNKAAVGSTATLLS